MPRIFRAGGDQRRQHVNRRSFSLQIPAPEEYQRLLDEVTEDPFRTMLVAALSLGLRKSELLALQWGDFDRDGSRLQIRRMKAGTYRRHYLPPAAATAFRDWRSKSPFNAESDWVFADPRRQGQAPYDARWLWQRQFRPAAIRAGILKRFEWHTLRTTSVVMWLSLGMDAFTVSTLLLRSLRTTLNCVVTVSSSDLVQFRKLAQKVFLGLEKQARPMSNVLPWRKNARRSTK